MKRAVLLTAIVIIFTIPGSSLTYAQNLQVEDDAYSVYLPLIIQYRPPEADVYEPDDDWDEDIDDEEDLSESLEPELRAFLQKKTKKELIELLLVILIIGILAGLAIPRFAKRSENARIVAARVDVQANLATALDLYELDNGAYPTTTQGLEALVARPSTPPIPERWSGPYIRRLPLDPWNHKYVYHSPCARPSCDYEILSFGPDGKEGGDDDITSSDGTSQ